MGIPLRVPAFDFGGNYLTVGDSSKGGRKTRPY
jgi:hypothetical protein